MSRPLSSAARDAYALARTQLESVVLSSETAAVFLAPERGGMATRFFVGDRPLFFLDESTLVDRSKNVRGGNPVLFPSPGKLTDDRFEIDGKSGRMGQHGFARNEAWEVARSDDRSVELRLVSNERTRAVYPWEFVAHLIYTLEANRLRIVQRLETNGESPVPFAWGFHPYFFVRDADKAKTSIPTRASRAFDNFGKKIISLSGPIDLTAQEVDLHLFDHGSSRASLHLPDDHRIELVASNAVGIDAEAEPSTRWVVWTQRGKDFVCLEPWSAPADALNTREGLLYVTRTMPFERTLDIAFV